MSTCNRLDLETLGSWLRATSHMSQESWPRNCKSPGKGKCAKVVPRHLQNHVVWSRILKCSVKPWYVTRASTKCYFNEVEQIKRLCTFGMSRSPGFVLGPPPRGGFWKQSKWPWNMIHSMPPRHPCRLYIHLAITYILHFSLKRSVPYRTCTGSTFSTNESCLKWTGLTGS